MNQNLISILCEGPHDVAFISKVLKNCGFESYDAEKLGKYPKPIGSLILNEVKKTDIANLNLQEIRHSIIPSATLKRNVNYLFLYSLGGDSRSITRKKYLENLLSLIPKENEINVGEGYSFGLIYFFDSDEKGVLNRIDELNIEIEEVISQKPFTNHHEIHDIEGLRLGCLIFTNDENSFGKLEDVIIPLMRLNNENIFGDAQAYLDKHYDKNRASKKFDYKKSTIGIVGQLQKSGSSNVVCISQTDFITSDKISASHKCMEIIDFVNKFT